MHSHLRGVLLWEIFRTIRQRALPEKRINAVVEFRITGRRDGGIDRYRLTLADGRCRASRRDGRRPALTLELEPVAFLRLVSGTASPQRLLLAGKLRLRGHLCSRSRCPGAQDPEAPPAERGRASAELEKCLSCPGMGFWRARF